MFNFKNPVITKVFNPLNITKNSMIEFDVGDLKGTGMYRFNLIAEFNIGNMTYSRYIIYSKSEDTEHVFEVFPGNEGIEPETYLYSLLDTIPFSEEFLNDIAGQRFLTSPDGEEYARCTMPENEDRIDGVKGNVKVYNVESDKIEKEFGVQFWEYSRELDGLTEYLTVEMSEETGMFKIFVGELLEDIFYKVYQTSNQE